MSLQALSKGNVAVALESENLLSWDHQPWDLLTGQFGAAPGDRDGLSGAVKPAGGQFPLEPPEAQLGTASVGRSRQNSGGGLTGAASAAQGQGSKPIWANWTASGAIASPSLTAIGAGWLGSAPSETAPETLLTGTTPHRRACACSACRGMASSSTLAAAGTTAPTEDFRVDALLSGTRLGTSGGAEVTFSFVNGLTASSYQGRYGEVVSELSDTIKTSVRTILKSYIEPLVGLTFTEVTEAIGTYGQMRLMFSDMGGQDSYAYAFYPEADDAYNRAEVNSLASDIHLSDAYRNPAVDPLNNFASGPSSHGFTTLIHEIGHALGLKHPNNYGSGTGSADPPYLPSSLDNLHNTVMSYNLAGSSPTTLMPFDIAALQHLYGAKSVNAGKTTYAFTSTHAFSTSDGATWGGPSAQRLTLVDSGGVDTLRLSALPFTSMGYYIDLRSGGVIADQSDLNTVTGNAGKGTRLSLNTTIEQVINSSSDDTIVANGAANVFGGYGTAIATGNDTIEGADSRDRLDLSAFAAASVGQTEAGSDLVLDLGAERSITLKDYYAASASDRIALQFAKVPAALAIAATDARMKESHANTKPFTFTVTRSGNLDGTTTVNWAVSGTGDNPANASDFASDAMPSGTVTFAAQETEQIVAVNVGGDLAAEADEAFAVTLSNPTNGATLTTATATGTILNDDEKSTFVNSQAIAMRDRSDSHPYSSEPYPSEIEVSALQGHLSDVQVTLKAIDHTWPDDIDILLVGPTGAKTLLLSDVGGASDIANVTLSFDAAATASLPDSTRLISGTYRPTNVGSGDRFAAPAPAGPYDADLSVFKGTDPNGTWRLYVADDTGFDQGAIAAGWSLMMTTDPLTPTAADILNAIQATAGPISAQADTAWI